MKCILLSLALLASLPAYAVDVLEEIVVDDDSYALSIDKKEKNVVVEGKAPVSKAPDAVRLLIHRKGKKPLELRLHATERPDGLPRYSGRAEQWNGNMIGFQLEFRFDKKSWKTILKKFTP